MARRSLRITSRFALVVVVLVPSLAAVAFIGFHGMESGRSGVNSLYSDHLVTLRSASELEISLEAADVDGWQLLATDDLAKRARIATDLLASVSPRVDAEIAVVRAEAADDPLERPQAARIAAEWAGFQRLLASGALDATRDHSPRRRPAADDDLRDGHVGS